MPLEDEDLQEQLGMTTQTGFSSSRGQNPYTTQLQDLLGKYLEQSDKQATEKQAILDKARERLLSRHQVLLTRKLLSVSPEPLANQPVQAASLRHWAVLAT